MNEMNFGSNIIRFNNLPSTNSYLKEKCYALPHGSVIITKQQTAGKGRFNRKWISGDDLLLSLLIKENIKLTEVSKLGLVFAAAVYRTLKEFHDDITIKWPNDIMINGKKIAGILMESIITDNKLNCLIVGIGINVNTISFPKSIYLKTTSLKKITGHNYDIEIIVNSLLGNVNDLYFDFKLNNDHYIDVCIENSCLIGKDIIYNDGYHQYQGIVQAILRNGNILIETNGIVKEYSHGEISLSSFN